MRSLPAAQPCFGIRRDGRRRQLDWQAGGVDAQVIPCFVAPAQAGNHAMHACARDIHLPHAFFHLAVGQVLVFRRVSAAARELGGQIRIDKQIKRPPVLKYARCAAANDDTVSPLGQRADDAPLGHEQLERLLGNRRIGGKAAPKMQRKARGHAPAEQVFHIPFAGICLTGQFF